MKLETHIGKSGLSVIGYAKVVGVGQATMYKAIQGEYSPDTAQKIFDYSGGKVVLIIRPVSK